MSVGEKFAVVIGATGNIGRGAALHFAKNGCRTVLVGRDLGKLNALVVEFLVPAGAPASAFVPVVADMTTWVGAASAAEQIRQLTPTVDHVVSSSGPWWTVPKLNEMDPAVFTAAFSANVHAHFFAWRALSLVTNRTFMVVNGAAADSFPRSGLTGLTASTVKLLSSLMVLETPTTLRAVEVYIAARVADNEGPHAISPSRFGAIFTAIAEGRAAETSGSITVNGALLATLGI
jgi:NAD(P)-dependent dehydrogenase (short-subunit alcohol dehydrogenase family)